MFRINTIIPILFGLFIFQHPCFAQTYKRDTVVIKALEEQILRYKKAFLEDDAKTAIEMTHPELREKMGGEAKMMASNQKSKEIRQQYKMSFVGLDYVLPDSILVTDKSYQVAFPVEIPAKFEDGEITVDRKIMIAFGDIASSAWYFLVVPSEGIEQVKAALSFVDAKLVVPK